MADLNSVQQTKKEKLRMSVSLAENEITVANSISEINLANGQLYAARKDLERFDANDHNRDLCGKPDVPENTPEETLRDDPAHCLCCGSEMNIVQPSSVGMQQLGIYALICAVCP